MLERVSTLAASGVQCGNTPLLSIDTEPTTGDLHLFFQAHIVKPN